MIRQRGFTLLEVLIAITITAVIGLGVWQVMNGVITARDRVNDVAEEFNGLQKAFLLMERDIGQVVNRPARDVYGDFEPALTNQGEEFDLKLTRQGWRNPLGTRRSNMQRAAYEYTGSELRRRYWVSVDQGQEDNSRDQLLLEDVTAFEIRFLDSERNWVDQWPTDEAMANLSPGARPDIPLPLGIEITLEHERFGELVRVFALPDFDAGEAQGVVNQSNEQVTPPEGEEEEGQQEQNPQGTGGGA